MLSGRNRDSQFELQIVIWLQKNKHEIRIRQTNKKICFQKWENNERICRSKWKNLLMRKNRVRANICHLSMTDETNCWFTTNADRFANDVICWKMLKFASNKKNAKVVHCSKYWNKQSYDVTERDERMTNSLTNTIKTSYKTKHEEEKKLCTKSKLIYSIVNVE